MTGIISVCRGEIHHVHDHKTTKTCKIYDQEAHENQQNDEQNQLSLLEVLVSALRKSMLSCKNRHGEDEDVAIAHLGTMEIGWPTDVQHVTHVTFDRFDGFLGLPAEFEVDVPCEVPSASASVFGVSPESMQCCYDARGNSVPTILLLLQERLYSQGGLKAEGIFRINPENSKEEYVRGQLNRGIVVDDIDVHCLAGLIKAWFRELPSGVLDGLSPEQVLACNTEEESVDLVKLLKPTEAALLNWAVDLMADIVEEEESNKMNARNIAMVFAPNMTQMSDPLTALMHAVQVMNLLKTLIIKTLRERDDASSCGFSPMSYRSSDHQHTYYNNHAPYIQSSEGEENDDDEVEDNLYKVTATKLTANESSKSCYNYKEESGISVAESFFSTTSDAEEDSGSSYIQVARKVETKSVLKCCESNGHDLIRDMILDAGLPLPCAL